jgi:hypothetical protein
MEIIMTKWNNVFDLVIKPMILFVVLGIIGMFILALTGCGDCEGDRCVNVECVDCIPDTKCPEGQTLVDNTCVPDTKCPEGFTFNGTICEPVICKVTEVISSCICDIDTQILIDDTCCCKVGYHAVDDECVPVHNDCISLCVYGYKWDECTRNCVVAE